MSYCRFRLRLCTAPLLVMTLGCADAFLNLGTALSTLGDGLYSVGTCLSPLTPVELDDLFDKAPAVVWTERSVEVTDEPQPEIQAYLYEQVGPYVLPVKYQVLRFYQLGPLAAGEVIQIEPLSDVVDMVALYDADYTLIPVGAVHDFDGRRRMLQAVIDRDTAVAWLRVDLEFPSERNEAIVRLTRGAEVASSSPPPQTVVLHFGGAEEVTFRNGYLLPAQVGVISDPVVRQAAVEQFRGIYGPYNLIVLTDEDPPPEPPFSVIHIGSAQLSTFNYGLAEIVDSGNFYPDDVAIVDADQPALQIAQLLGPQTFGRAIGLIAAHEMGHMLGLEHVSDPDALMTGAQCQGTSADVERMLRRQLTRSPVVLFAADLQQWSLGDQDAAADVLQVLGPATP